MQSLKLALALIAVGAVSPAFGQARVLSAPEQGSEQTPAPRAPMSGEHQPTGETPAGKVDDTGPAPNNGQGATPLQREDAGQPPAPVSERYSFNRVDGGLLRLDRRSGEVALCRAVSGGWVCEAVPEERAALEKEIDHLRAEIAALRKEVASLRDRSLPPIPPQTVPPQARPGKPDGPAITLPTVEHIARARAFLAETWHRLVEMIDHWQNEMLRKS